MSSGTDLDRAVELLRARPYDGGGNLPTDVRTGWQLADVVHELRNITRPMRHRLRGLAAAGADVNVVAHMITACDRLDAMADGIAATLKLDGS